MAVYRLSQYPRDLHLRNGSAITVWPMEAADVDGLLKFFAGTPEDERCLFKENATSRAVVQGWADHLGYDRALPLLARTSGRIVGDAVLLRHRGDARSHVAEIRITMAPDYRG